MHVGEEIEDCPARPTSYAAAAAPMRNVGPVHWCGMTALPLLVYPRDATIYQTVER